MRQFVSGVRLILLDPDSKRAAELSELELRACAHKVEISLIRVYAAIELLEFRNELVLLFGHGLCWLVCPASRAALEVIFFRSWPGQPCAMFASPMVNRVDPHSESAEHATHGACDGSGWNAFEDARSAKNGEDDNAAGADRGALE